MGRAVRLCSNIVKLFSFCMWIRCKERETDLRAYHKKCSQKYLKLHKGIGGESNKHDHRIYACITFSFIMLSQTNIIVHHIMHACTP